MQVDARKREPSSNTMVREVSTCRMDSSHQYPAARSTSVNGTGSTAIRRSKKASMSLRREDSVPTPLDFFLSSWNFSSMCSKKSGSVKHPLTGKVLPPKPLFGQAPADPDPDADPREALAAWMTAPSNPYFPRVIVNRTWAELMGRGIVEPVDDLRATNPPSNGPLLDALAEDFVAHGYDLKHLIRTILSSHVYGLSDEPVDANAADTRNYSRHYRQRLRAEVIGRCLCHLAPRPEARLLAHHHRLGPLRRVP